MLGRSNVGKSTLLGAVLRHPSLIRTSRTPGRTQALNYFKDNDDRVFVDLPGYGYADVPPKVARDMLQLIAEYVEMRDQLRGVMLLLDARREEPSEDDLMWFDKIQNAGRRLTLIVTKIDRIPKAKQKPMLAKLSARLSVDPKHVIGCSAETGQGLDDVRKAVDDLFRHG